MNYNEIDGVNQSTLKKILDSPKSYLAAKNKQEENIESEEEHFVFGTIVDLMLTGTREDFNKRFAKVPENLKFSSNITLLLKEVLIELNKMSVEEASTKTLKDFNSFIIKWCRNNKYQPKWGDDALIKNIVTEDVISIFEIMKTTVGKTIVKESEYKNALQCKSVLENDPFTEQYVNKKTTKLEFWDKFIIIFEYKGILCKGESDRICIDHVNKLIIPIDFKYTGKPILNFSWDFWKYRYDFQSAFYRHGLFEHPKIQELLKDGYKIDNFLYIVVEKALYQPPFKFRVPDEVNKIGREGGTLSDGRKLEGFTQAIDRYKFATDNNKWEYPMEYYQNQFLDIKV